MLPKPNCLLSDNDILLRTGAVAEAAFESSMPGEASDVLSEKSGDLAVCFFVLCDGLLSVWQWKHSRRFDKVQRPADTDPSFPRIFLGMWTDNRASLTHTIADFQLCTKVITCEQLSVLSDAINNEVIAMN